MNPASAGFFHRNRHPGSVPRKCPPGISFIVGTVFFLLTRKRPPRVAAPRPNSPVRGVLPVAALLGASRSGGGQRSGHKRLSTPPKKARVARRYRRRRGLGVPLPLPFPWLVEPDSRQPVSLPLPRLRFTSAPAYGGSRPLGRVPLYDDGRWRRRVCYYTIAGTEKERPRRAALRVLPFRCGYGSRQIPPAQNSRLTIASSRGILWVYGRIVHRTMEHPPAWRECSPFRLPSDDATVGRFFVCTYSPHRREAPPLRR